MPRSRLVKCSFRTLCLRAADSAIMDKGVFGARWKGRVRDGIRAKMCRCNSIQFRVGDADAINIGLVESNGSLCSRVPESRVVKLYGLW